jgi:hypothetical protein
MSGDSSEKKRTPFWMSGEGITLIVVGIVAIVLAFGTLSQIPGCLQEEMKGPLKQQREERERQNKSKTGRPQ